MTEIRSFGDEGIPTNNLRRKRRSTFLENVRPHETFLSDDFDDLSSMMGKMFEDLDSVGFGHMSPMFTPKNNNIRNRNRNRFRNKNRSRSQWKPNLESSIKIKKKKYDNYRGKETPIILKNYNDVIYYISN